MKMTNPSTCIFCRIVSGELPSNQSFSDDRVLAFADIHPVAPVHILVIPKEHIERIENQAANTEGLLGHLLWVSAQVAANAGLSERGYRLVVNQGSDAGQLVDHLHIHVLGGREMSQLA